MSSQGEYYDVQKFGDEWVAMYDPEQQLMGKSFKTEAEARAYVEDDMNPTDTNQASELYELCKKVYELTGWETPDWFDLDTEDGKPDEYLLTYEDVTIGQGGEIRPKTCPFYTSDYLLEKLPREIDGNDLVLTPVMDTGWGACYEHNGLKTQAIDDTPLKALLRLTIALSEAGELK